MKRRKDAQLIVTKHHSESGEDERKRRRGRSRTRMKDVHLAGNAKNKAT